MHGAFRTLTLHLEIDIGNIAVGARTRATWVLHSQAGRPRVLRRRWPWTRVLPPVPVPMRGAISQDEGRIRIRLQRRSHPMLYLPLSRP